MCFIRFYDRPMVLRGLYVVSISSRLFTNYSVLAELCAYFALIGSAFLSIFIFIGVVEFIIGHTILK